MGEKEGGDSRFGFTVDNRPVQGAAPVLGQQRGMKVKSPQGRHGHTASGSILKATTIWRSAFRVVSSSRKAGFFSFSGCNTGRSTDTAYLFTALSVTFSPALQALIRSGDDPHHVVTVLDKSFEALHGKFRSTHKDDAELLWIHNFSGYYHTIMVSFKIEI